VEPAGIIVNHFLCLLMTTKPFTLSALSGLFLRLVSMLRHAQPSAPADFGSLHL